MRQSRRGDFILHCRVSRASATGKMSVLPRSTR